jgi:hypothetical protein
MKKQIRRLFFSAIILLANSIHSTTTPPSGPTAPPGGDTLVNSCVETNNLNQNQPACSGGWISKCTGSCTGIKGPTDSICSSCASYTPDRDNLSGDTCTPGKLTEQGILVQAACTGMSCGCGTFAATTAPPTKVTIYCGAQGSPCE